MNSTCELSHRCQMSRPIFTIHFLNPLVVGCLVLSPSLAQQLDDPFAQTSQSSGTSGLEMLQVQPAIIPFTIRPESLVDPFSTPPNELLSPQFPTPTGFENFDAVAIPNEEPNTQLENDSQFSEDGLYLADPPLPSQNFGAFGTPGFSSPSGFEGGSSWMSQGAMLGDSIRDGLSLGLSVSGTYDSNPSQGLGSDEDSGEGDFFANINGSVSYQTQASVVKYNVNYSGGYNQYFNQSDLSGYNQSAGAGMTYERGPLSLGLSVGLDLASGANRNYSAIVDETRFGIGLNARYLYSPKTSLTANFSTGITSASGGEISDTGAYNFGASALWRYSPRTEFGPGLRYAISSGDEGGDRTSIGPTLACNYQLARKISLNSVVGADFASYEDGESTDPSLFTNVGLNYRASEVWGMNLSLSRDTQASFLNAGEFDETTALRIGYNRRIRRVSWQVGFGLENRSALENDGASSSQVDREYFTANTSLGTSIFANTTNVSVALRYSDQSGGTAESWDSFQVGFTIGRSF